MRLKESTTKCNVPRAVIDIMFVRIYPFIQIVILNTKLQNVLQGKVRSIFTIFLNPSMVKNFKGKYM